jgi:hypothetical protein
MCFSSSSVLDAALSAKPNLVATWVLRTETLQLGRLPPLDGAAVSVSLPLDMLPYRLLLRLPAPLKYSLLYGLSNDDFLSEEHFTRPFKSVLLFSSAVLGLGDAMPAIRVSNSSKSPL